MWPVCLQWCTCLLIFSLKICDKCREKTHLVVPHSALSPVGKKNTKGLLLAFAFMATPPDLPRRIMTDNITIEQNRDVLKADKATELLSLEPPGMPRIPNSSWPLPGMKIGGAGSCSVCRLEREGSEQCLHGSLSCSLSVPDNKCRYFIETCTDSPCRTRHPGSSVQRRRLFVSRNRAVT